MEVSLTRVDINRHRNFKMSAAKVEVVITFVLLQIDTKFQRLHLGFRGGRGFNGLVADTSRHQLTQKIQDGDRQIGSGYYFCSMAGRHEITKTHLGF